MFVSVNLFSTSVGGIVFIDFGSLCAIMVSTVDFMVLPRRIPRCLELSRVVIPRRCKCSQSGAGVLMHNAVVMTMLLLSPLTSVYSLFWIMRECHAVEKETSRKLTVAGLPKAAMTM